MKLFGSAEKEDAGMELLGALTLVGEPQSLRELASFLYRCADALEDEGSFWEQDAFDSSEHVCPQIVVFNPALLDD
jgi:hypothetical protein